MKRCSSCKIHKSLECFYYLSSKCRECNQIYMRKYHQQRRKTDINYKLLYNLRIRLRSALKQNAKTGSTLDNLGCSILELQKYLESKFQSGMTWDNYGQWHIDHIKPLCSFNLTNESELIQACHYTNLQPLWAKDNISKGKAIINK